MGGDLAAAQQLWDLHTPEEIKAFQVAGYCNYTLTAFFTEAPTEQPTNSPTRYYGEYALGRQA